MISIDKKKLQALMTEREIRTLAELARRADLHQNTLHNCLRDGATFDSRTLGKLATALQCSPVDLMTWNGFSESFSLAPASL